MSPLAAAAAAGPPAGRRATGPVPVYYTTVIIRRGRIFILIECFLSDAALVRGVRRLHGLLAVR